MTRSTILLRHLAVVRRTGESTRVYVTELASLVGLLAALYVVFWLSFSPMLAHYPWLPLVLIVPLYPRLNIRITHDAVAMRWWIGPFPVPLGRRHAMSAEGTFESEESMDGNDAWTIEYSEGGLFAFAPFPSRLASILNAELRRVREGSSPDRAPEAWLVKESPKDNDA